MKLIKILSIFVVLAVVQNNFATIESVRIYQSIKNKNKKIILIGNADDPNTLVQVIDEVDYQVLCTYALQLAALNTKSIFYIENTQWKKPQKYKKKQPDYLNSLDALATLARKNNYQMQNLHFELPDVFPVLMSAIKYIIIHFCAAQQDVSNIKSFDKIELNSFIDECQKIDEIMQRSFQELFNMLDQYTAEQEEVKSARQAEARTQILPNETDLLARKLILSSVSKALKLEINKYKQLFQNFDLKKPFIEAIVKYVYDSDKSVEEISGILRKIWVDTTTLQQTMLAMGLVVKILQQSNYDTTVIYISDITCLNLHNTLTRVCSYKLVNIEGENNWEINHLVRKVQIIRLQELFGLETKSAVKMLKENFTKILKKIKTCNGCNKTKEVPFRCGQCQNSYYCSQQCQRAHWNIHKIECSSKTKGK